MEQTHPYLTASLPGTGGALRASVDDFVVDELPSYEPSGSGEHTLARVEKRGVTTPDAVERIARALGVHPRDVGYAGLNDRHARTTQWISVPRVDPARVLGLELEGLRVLEAARHGNKIRTGHLRGNRFTLRVTGLADLDEALARARAIDAVLSVTGVPNYYGEQRFGRDGANRERGLRWLRGEVPAPRDRFQRKLLASSVQSSLFNESLAERVTAGELARWVDGDLAVRHAHGRPWAITEADAAALYPSFEASATGPMFGPKMPRATGELGRREEASLLASGVTLDDLARAGDLAEGARRAVRVRAEGMTITREPSALRFEFTLPPGAYATVVMRELMKPEAVDGLKLNGSGGIQPAPQAWSDDAH
ncbi:MAG: tRNA pseudouridine(13) synthase TruD [Polyangiales bacterium]